MKRGSEARPNLGILLAIGILPLLALQWIPFPLLQGFENAAYDGKMKLREALAPQPISETVRLIGVSDAEKEYLKEDLGSRQVYVDLLTRMRDWNVQSVAFDIFFIEEQSRDSILAFTLGEGVPPATLGYYFTNRVTPISPPGDPPPDFADSYLLAENGIDTERLEQETQLVSDYLATLRQSEERQRELRYEPDAPDRMSAAELSQLQRAILWTRDLQGSLLRRWFVLTHGLALEDIPAETPAAADLRLLSPKPLLASPSMGFANLDKGTEDVVRRAPLLYQWRGCVFPQLSLAAVLEYYGVRFQDVKIDWGRAIRFTPQRNGSESVAIPIDAGGRYLVNYREAESYLRRNPLLTPLIREGLEKEAIKSTPAEFFQDSIVVLGEVITGGEATDIEPIPLSNQFPMVGLHANIIDNVLRRDFLRLAGPLEIFLIYTALGAAAALFFYFFSFSLAAQLTAALLAVYTVAEYLMFQQAGWVLPVVTPVLGSGVSVLFFFAYVIVVKDRDRRMVRDVFLKSVSPRIGEEILKNYNDESIWGARRTITVLFIDIRGYTAMSETQDPDIVLQLLDGFYEKVSECVFRHEGQVNKFLGDAVLALFGALAEEPGDHARRAVQAAADISLAMAEFNDSDLVQALGVPLSTGCGLNTGEATVGLVGRKQLRIEYTALGDPVNVASRLQGAAEHGETIISGETMRSLGGAEAFRQLFPGIPSPAEERISVKGKSEPLIVYRMQIIPSKDANI